ncbi:hypothetical protein [Dactylosporangium sp. NPDC000521]|uniref:hypothetical protein n=1 Tax=Dactylosporangium sp. NPDC000521 TaxID=3363975 RepID=UPI003698CA56
MTADPVARAVLRRVTELRPPDDPLHAFATTVLSGEATLRAAATHPAFTEALEATLDARLEATPEARLDARLGARLEATLKTGLEATLEAGLEATLEAVRGAALDDAFRRRLPERGEARG